MDNICIVLREGPYILVRTGTSKKFVLHHDEDGGRLTFVSTFAVLPHRGATQSAGPLE